MKPIVRILVKDIEFVVIGEGGYQRVTGGYVGVATGEWSSLFNTGLDEVDLGGKVFHVLTLGCWFSYKQPSPHFLQSFGHVWPPRDSCRGDAVDDGTSLLLWSNH